jgi:hypothetical protein
MSGWFDGAAVGLPLVCETGLSELLTHSRCTGALSLLKICGCVRPDDARGNKDRVTHEDEFASFDDRVGGAHTLLMVPTS